MRLSAENKAASERCHRCGRPVGYGAKRCRPMPSGWFCWRDGLVIDPSKLLGPAPDPIGEAEQEVIDRFAPQIAEAQQAVDEALASYTMADMAHQRALIEATAAGANTGPRGAMLSPADYPAREPTQARRHVLEAAESRLYRARSAAGERLGAARRTLIRIEERCHLERRAAARETA